MPKNSFQYCLLYYVPYFLFEQLHCKCYCLVCFVGCLWRSRFDFMHLLCFFFVVLSLPFWSIFEPFLSFFELTCSNLNFVFISFRASFDKMVPSPWLTRWLVDWNMKNEKLVTIKLWGGLFLTTENSVWPDGSIIFQYMAICNDRKCNKFTKVGLTFYQIRNKPPKICQRLVKCCQRGKILPNLVTWLWLTKVKHFRCHLSIWYTRFSIRKRFWYLT